MEVKAVFLSMTAWLPKVLIRSAGVARKKGTKKNATMQNMQEEMEEGRVQQTAQVRNANR